MPRPVPEKAVILARLIVTTQALRQDCKLLELPKVCKLLDKVEQELTEQHKLALGT